MLRKLLSRWLQTRNKHTAIYWKQKLAIVYAFAGWNAFAIMLYAFVKKKTPEDATGRRGSYGLLTGAPSNVQVYQITGMTLTDNFNMQYKTEETQEEQENEKNNC